MTEIFLSYRRSDTQQIVGRMFDRLSKRFDVYLDVDTIPAGTDFRQHIEEAAKQSSVFLALIGIGWLEKGLTGHPRILDPTDWVRVELETAIELSKPLIPVLIGRATMPREHELPRSLKNFPYLNAAHVDEAKDFHIHMNRLVGRVEKLTSSTAPTGAVPKRHGKGRSIEKQTEMPAASPTLSPMAKGERVSKIGSGAAGRPPAGIAPTTAGHGLDPERFRRFVESKYIDLLQQVLPGTWEVTPAAQSDWALRIEMREDGHFQGELPSPGWPQPNFAIQGDWVLLRNHLTMTGDRISALRATPFHRSFTFQQVTDNELVASMLNIRVTWRRLRKSL
jgi:hypothetical protein